MKDLFDIKGKVAVMTGACGILGTTIVKYFAVMWTKPVGDIIYKILIEG